MRAVWTSLILLALAGCASGPPKPGDGPSGPTIDELTQQCQARGGLLAPSGGPLTGRPALDYTCRISPAEPARTR
jgi:hypothetical protein